MIGYLDDALDMIESNGGRTVEYLPASGSSRSISALTVQQPREDDGAGMSRSGRILWRVHVVNDDGMGISEGEVTVGKDQIRFPITPGGDDKDWTIRKIPEDGRDVALLILECS